MIDNQEKMANDDKVNVWVEKLGLIELIIFSIQCLFSGVIIRYDKYQISPFVIRLIGFLKKINFCGNFFPASLSLNKKDSKGYALNYQMENNLESCLEEFCNLHIPDEPDWFKRMVKSYMASFLFYRITFITMIESEIESKEKQKNILYLFRHPLNSLFIPFYEKKGFIIKVSPCWIENLMFYLRSLYLILAILISRVSPVKVKTNIANVKPAVWVEYTHKDLVDFLFWRKAVDSNQSDIVYYLDRKDTPAVQEIVNEIEKNGLKWIDLHLFSLIKLSQLGLTELRKPVLELVKKYSCTPFWFKLFYFENRLLYLIYSSVFRYFQVKILIQHQEFSWKQSIQARALELSGGCMMGFHWSNFPYYLEPAHLTPQHVYFVWGKAKHDWVQKKGNTCRYILPSGLLITSNNNEAIEYSFSKGVNFIISIFDSSVNYNIYQSPDTLSQFYFMVIKLLEANKDWGGIIKSKIWEKNNLDFLPEGKEIIRRIEALEDQERIVFLNRTTSPPLVARYADLSVCYGLNSAGIIVGAYGYRAIHWDCSGWLNHPFYKEKGQKILYTSLEDFQNAIAQAAKGDKDIGDFSRWQEDFNYFNDYSAPERVGMFIRTFMDEVIKTDNMEHSLDYSVQRYIKENKVGDDFFQNGALAG